MEFRAEKQMTPPKVGQVSEGIPHAYKSVKTFASAIFLHAFMQSQPISFLDNWKEKKSTNQQFSNFSCMFLNPNNFFQFEF